MAKVKLTLNDIASILGVDVSVVNRHMAGSEIHLEKEGGEVYVTVGRFRGIINLLRFYGFYLLADVIEDRLESFLASQ